MVTPLELALAFALDAAVGDPRWFPHPVRAMGWGIGKTERMLRRRLGGRVGGVVIVFVIVGASGLLAWLVFRALRMPSSPVAAFLASAAVTYLASTTISLRGLLSSVRAVFRSGSIAEARRRLGHIVGRDTARLERAAVHRAALESLSENASDGVVAPLFYLAIGGLPLAIAYKAANTLDSMVGYKDEQYRDFGWAAARLDDVLNYLPARITGLLIAAAAMVLLGPRHGVRSFRIMGRDGRNHASPNSGFPEAALAGALGIRLGGPSTYGGKVIEKPFIGEDRTEVTESLYRKALGIIALASAFGLMLSLLLVSMRTVS